MVFLWNLPDFMDIQVKQKKNLNNRLSVLVATLNNRLWFAQLNANNSEKVHYDDKRLIVLPDAFGIWKIVCEVGDVHNTEQHLRRNYESSEKLSFQQH